MLIIHIGIMLVLFTIRDNHDRGWRHYCRYSTMFREFVLTVIITFLMFSLLYKFYCIFDLCSWFELPHVFQTIKCNVFLWNVLILRDCLLFVATMNVNMFHTLVKWAKEQCRLLFTVDFTPVSENSFSSDSVCTLLPKHKHVYTDLDLLNNEILDLNALQLIVKFDYFFAEYKLAVWKCAAVKHKSYVIYFIILLPFCQCAELLPETFTISWFLWSMTETCLWHWCDPSSNQVPVFALYIYLPNVFGFLYPSLHCMSGEFLK